MACGVLKFTINKGLVNEFIITIKKNGSLTAIEIDPSDTFKLTMFRLGTDEVVGEVDGTLSANGQITTYSAINGQILVSLSDALVNSLVKSVGEEVDRYYVKPTYRIAIECATVDNGKFVAKIPLVYVE